MDIPLIPRDPAGPLYVIVLGRLSKPKKTQEETQESIESSFAFAKEHLARLYAGEVDIRCLGEQISGLIVDRQTIQEAWELIETGEWDLVLTEDLGRVYRNPRHQYAFAQDCVDAGIRLIAINDRVDTADDNWEIMLAAAAFRHGTHIPDARLRIKRKAKYSFHAGGMVTRVRFGYRKLSREQATEGTFGAKGVRIARCLEHQAVFDEIRRRLLAGQSPAAVVDWMNRENVPLGPGVKRKHWNAPLFKTLVTDPILHGVRLFRKVTYTSIFGSGKPRRDRNPNPERELIPELAFMTEGEQIEMLAAAGWSLDWGSGAPKTPTRRRKIRSKVIWPGQAATCAICGSSMLSNATFLICSQAIKVNGKKCWNHVHAPIAEIQRQTVAFLLNLCRAAPANLDALVNAALETLRKEHAAVQAKKSGYERERKQLQNELHNLTEAIAQGADFKSLIEMIAAKEQRLQEINAASLPTKKTPTEWPYCATREDLIARLDDILPAMVSRSTEFAAVLREHFVSFKIQPVQAIDSGQVHPRALLEFMPCDFKDRKDGSSSLLLQWDLFTPPLHVLILPLVLPFLTQTKRPTLRAIGAEIGANYMTVKRAIKYANLMETHALTEPYRVLIEEPEYASRWRR